MSTDEYLTHSSLHNLKDPNSCGFDCNICLDTVQDPVVTICGHLYCWPCIYKWIEQEHKICPVCKSQLSEKTLIPLYGRGQSDEKPDDLGPIIPDRPRGPPYVVGAAATSATTTTTEVPSQDEYSYSYTSAPDVRSAAFHPMIGMFAEMISTRFSGRSQPFYSYPNSYGVVCARDARVRRNVDQSLSRLSIFLYCCLVFCLLFF